MVERKRTRVIVLGELEISGSKIVHKRLSVPKTSARIFNKNITIYPALDVRKIIFRVPIKYKEATTKQDTPNFLFALRQNVREIKKSDFNKKKVKKPIERDVMNMQEKYTSKVSGGDR